MNRDERNQHILIVEDDEPINGIIRDALTREGFRCTSAYSGTEALIHLTRQDYQLVILDLMLPGLSGEGLMRQIRNELNIPVPVIVLTAKDHLDHKLDLFTLGANDYVTKPFELEELIARIRVHIAKSNVDSAPSVYAHKNLLLDCNVYSASVNGEPLALTRQEYKILELLIKNPTRVFTKQDLYELAWDDVYLGEDKTITVHISNIRSKLKSYDLEPYIDTLWGIGFRLSG
ncbi:response regulator transcription factor [Saccharibacillus sacchari]|uniref:Response regulator transcription factor n=1 Tax=Saccharibacillus sacchari TaxID=456493 RepID=A0ACC6P636_9BACL